MDGWSLVQRDESGERTERERERERQVIRVLFASKAECIKREGVYSSVIYICLCFPRLESSHGDLIMGNTTRSAPKKPKPKPNRAVSLRLLAGLGASQTSSTPTDGCSHLSTYTSPSPSPSPSPSLSIASDIRLVYGESD